MAQQGVVDKEKPFQWRDVLPAVPTPMTPAVIPKRPPSPKKEPKLTQEEHYLFMKSGLNDCLRDAWIYFSEFCFVTEMHGIKYVAQNRSRAERIIWIIIVLLAIGTAIYMCYMMYDRYKTAPIVVSFGTTEVPVYTVPFPAVTICPEIKISAFHDFNYDTVIENLANNQSVSEDNKKLLMYISSVCDKHRNNSHVVKFLKTESFDNEFYDILTDLQPSYEILFTSCKFRGIELNCSKLFTPVLTKEGICYTFNLIDRTKLFQDKTYFYKNFFKAVTNKTNWNVYDGYKRIKNISQTYPRRAFHTAAERQLKITLTVVKKGSNVCKSYRQGYRLHLHSPIQIPRPNINYFHIPFGALVAIAVEPEYQTTSKVVSGFAKEKRKCIFDNEVQLEYFKLYEQDNCITECLTDALIKDCNCTKFYFPRSMNIPICGSSKNKCIKDSLKRLREMKVATHLKSERDPSVKPICDCAPSCTRLTYNGKVSQSNWNFKSYLIAHEKEILKSKYNSGMNISRDDVQMTQVIIYIDREQFTVLERDEIYGIFDLVANLGGLMGLFTGISLITIVEIVYFLTLRICCNNRIYGKWSGNPSI